MTRLTCLIVCVGSVWPSQQDTSLLVSIIEKIVGLDLWIFCDFLGPHNFCKTSEPAMPLMIPNFKVGLIIRCVLTPPPVYLLSFRDALYSQYLFFSSFLSIRVGLVQDRRTVITNRKCSDSCGGRYINVPVMLLSSIYRVLLLWFSLFQTFQSHSLSITFTIYKTRQSHRCTRLNLNVSHSDRCYTLKCLRLLIPSYYYLSFLSGAKFIGA